MLNRGASAAGLDAVQDQERFREADMFSSEVLESIIAPPAVAAFAHDARHALQPTYTYHLPTIYLPTYLPTHLPIRPTRAVLAKPTYLPTTYRYPHTYLPSHLHTLYI